MDHAGAVVGPLVATALLALGFSMRSVFAFAIVPGVLAIFALLTVREPSMREDEKLSAASDSPQPTPKIGDRTQRAIPRALRAYLVILGIFALGSSSDAFLLLRAQALGVSIELIPVLWAVLHVSKVVWTWLGGGFADRMPKPKLVAYGWAVYACTYLALGLANEAWHVWVIFIGYGVYYGLTEPAEKAMVKELAPSWAHGRAFGLYHFVIGITAVPAGLLTGVLWQEISPFAALMVGAAIAVVSSLLLGLWSIQVEGRMGDVA
jgi:MFS family permease